MAKVLEHPFMYFHLSFPSFLSVLSLSLQLQSCLSVGMAVIQPNLICALLSCLSQCIPIREPHEGSMAGMSASSLHVSFLPVCLSVSLSVCLGTTLTPLTATHQCRPAYPKEINATMEAEEK